MSDDLIKRVREQARWETGTPWSHKAGVLLSEAATRIEQDAATIAALRAENARLIADGIHSCHPGCTRSGCVNERLRAELEGVRKDAARWRWWRNYWPALTSMQVARFVGLDLSRTYVQSPEQMDAVTDAASAAKGE